MFRANNQENRLYRKNLVNKQPCSRFFYRITESRYLYGKVHFSPSCNMNNEPNHGHFNVNFPKSW